MQCLLVEHLNYMYSQATTSTGDGCITNFEGTSAACPVASGMIALTLEASYVQNPIYVT